MSKTRVQCNPLGIEINELRCAQGAANLCTGQGDKLWRQVLAFRPGLAWTEWRRRTMSSSTSSAPSCVLWKWQSASCPAAAASQRCVCVFACVV